MDLSLFYRNPVTKFKYKFLLFLKSKSPKAAFVYDFIMSHHAKHFKKISLLQIKNLITDLVRQEFITSQSFNHNLIGQKGVDIEYQKANAICAIKDRGLEYLRKGNVTVITIAVGTIGAIIGGWKLIKTYIQ